MTSYSHLRIVAAVAVRRRNRGDLSAADAFAPLAREVRALSVFDVDFRLLKRVLGAVTPYEPDLAQALLSTYFPWADAEAL